MASDKLPLDTLAATVNTLLKRADKADDLRLSAAKYLVEAKVRVGAGEAGDVTWHDWHTANIKRSDRDIRRLLKLGGAPDPEVALDGERAKARTTMQTTRARGETKRTNVCPDQDEPATATPDDPALSETLDLQRRFPTDMAEKIVAWWKLGTTGPASFADRQNVRATVWPDDERAKVEATPAGALSPKLVAERNAFIAESDIFLHNMETRAVWACPEMRALAGIVEPVFLGVDFSGWLNTSDELLVVLGLLEAVARWRAPYDAAVAAKHKESARKAELTRRAHAIYPTLNADDWSRLADMASENEARFAAVKAEQRLSKARANVEYRARLAEMDVEYQDRLTKVFGNRAAPLKDTLAKYAVSQRDALLAKPAANEMATAAEAAD